MVCDAMQLDRKLPVAPTLQGGTVKIKQKPVMMGDRTTYNRTLSPKRIPF
jgi:hypothetical protein